LADNPEALISAIARSIVAGRSAGTIDRSLALRSSNCWLKDMFGFENTFFQNPG
jgi:hypothetical protein